MFGNDDQIKEAAAEFSGMFGLRGFPGQRFYVNKGQSYVSGGIVQLYVFDGDRGQAFAKATPDELRAQIVGRIGARRS